MILDTGPLVAAANRRDPDHETSKRFLLEARGTFVVPALVVAEATFMIERAGGAQAEARFLRSLRAPRFNIQAPTPEDLDRAADLVLEYADLPLGGTDATIVALAERMAETDIATLDRRHFSVVRPLHVQAFALLP